MKHKEAITALFVVIVIGAMAAFYFMLPRGTVKLQCPSSSLTVKSILGDIKIDSSKPAKITVGTYKLRRIEIAASNGNYKWEAVSVGPWGTLGPVKVQKNQTTVVEFGPPFKVRPNAHNRAGIVTVGITMFGRADEQYLPAMVRNGVSLLPPTAKITDEKGEVLATSKFEYG